MEPKPNPSSDSDLTPFGEVLYQMALSATRPAPIVNIVPGLRLSDLAERIARDLWAAWLIQTGAQGPAFDDMPPMTRARYRTMAARAIRATDPAFLIEAQQRAAVQTDEEVNATTQSPYDQPPTITVARHAIAAYECLIARGL